MRPTLRCELCLSRARTARPDIAPLLPPGPDDRLTLDCGSCAAHSACASSRVSRAGRPSKPSRRALDSNIGELSLDAAIPYVPRERAPRPEMGRRALDSKIGEHCLDAPIPYAPSEPPTAAALTPPTWETFSHPLVAPAPPPNIQHTAAFVPSISPAVPLGFAATTPATSTCQTIGTVPGAPVVPLPQAYSTGYVQGAPCLPSGMILTHSVLDTLFALSWHRRGGAMRSCDYLGVDCLPC